VGTQEEKVAPAKQPKRSSSRATLDHVTGSTGRDGAFDFASKTEILDRMSGQVTGGGARRKVDEFNKKAQLCAELAASAPEAGVRLSYEELARSWRELADEADRLAAGSKR
jgi:hypothetical protein